MKNETNLQPLSPSGLGNLISKRDGETKAGEQIILLPEDIYTLKDLEKACLLKAKAGARYAILGIPEDIGPRANFGRRGTAGAYNAFLKSFLNVQANSFFSAGEVLIAGAVNLDDLQEKTADLKDTPEDINLLRDACALVDGRVLPIISCLARAGLEIIVIGGGHNNTYPIQKAIAAETKNFKGFACLNCDPHSDFRILEGRHSGNGFSFAHQENLLKAYFVLGLHESYNSEITLKRLNDAGFSFRSYEDIKIRKKVTFDSAIEESINWIKKRGKELAIGLELDLDSIAFLPVSAETPNGLSAEETAQFVYRVACDFPEVKYLHLPEGAPLQHVNPDTGSRYVGRTVALQVLSYIKGRKEGGRQSRVQ